MNTVSVTIELLPEKTHCTKPIDWNQIKTSFLHELHLILQDEEEVTVDDCPETKIMCMLHGLEHQINIVLVKLRQILHFNVLDTYT